MDAKDFRLLVALDEDARQSLQALGRKVSLSPPAVRERLRRLGERGILQGYWLTVNPRVFGRQDLLMAFDPEWTRDAAMMALGGPDVAWVAWKVDGGLTVQVWPQDVKRGAGALTRFLGRDPIWQGVSGPTPPGQLTRLDWRVLDALVDDPRASIERLSHALGLSPKTVRSHVARLVRDETIFVVPRLGFLADSGDIVYHVAVSGTISFAALRRAMGDAVLVHETQDPPRKFLFCRADNLGELTATTHELGKRPEVTSVQLSLNREMFIGVDFLHRLVRERIQGSEEVRSSKGPR